MDLGNLLSATAVVLLLAKYWITASLFRVARRIDGSPGSRVLRILARTMLAISVAQTFLLFQQIGVDMAPNIDAHLAPIAAELVSQAIMLCAFVWAWWRLTHLD